ncbi:MAG TPA: hypothetical protein PKV41_01400 [Candidatus Omnitrophota bacterium]|nr:hypothetical protein [Candidatus Omnitrophota bacterium]
MRLKLSHLIFLFLLLPDLAIAELSVTSKWRIEQAIQRCNATGNALTYTKYWGDSVNDENRETVCIAEHFAQLATFEGEEWLENDASAFIKDCMVKSNKDAKEYQACLQAGVETVTQQLSSACRELGAEGLWDKDQCKHLISYIFITKFDDVLKKHRPILIQAMDNRFLGFLFHPVAATLLLMVFVLDVLILIDPGNWMRVSKVALVAGGVMCLSFFLEGQWRFLGMGVSVLISVMAIVWGHITALLNPKRKKTKRSW